MNRVHNRKIVLEDGAEFFGYSFGVDREIIAEIVFNTSMTGYQEILSDPSYTDQAVVMTYPLIGNYGICDGDYETEIPGISALIVREFNDEPSNFRAVHTLEQVMLKYGIVGIAGVDTRQLARYIRDRGTCRALITSSDTLNLVAVARLRTVKLPTDQVRRASTAAVWTSPAPEPRFHVAAVDCGMKRNIVRSLNARGCDVTVFPWDTAPEEIEKLKPDGIFISNGPGDPEDAKPVIELVRALRGKYPMFGICLGHQIIALSYGAKTYKLKFGHRGGNHPVKNLQTDKIEITSQNHSYAVDAGSLAGTGLEVTHINLLDRTVEGLKCGKDRVFSVQYHPESAPGPQDSAYLFDEFIGLMEEAYAEKN
ncbi:MAG: glutamine-hydrolyzing carbamoyl-phosphate synthase small subunit [Oscillospiraceae bacterium]|nr:glutamine-hydrolyzing carbamoyl-phosphate synthase small subunit [Oscillospiraceae bacterium]